MPRLVFLVVINAFLDKSVQVSLTILCLFAGELCRGKPYKKECFINYTLPS